MKLRRGLAILVLLAFTVIPVMADPAVVTGDIYTGFINDLGVGHVETPARMMTGYYGYTNLYVKAAVSPWISTTYWLYYYMGYNPLNLGINASTVPSTSWLIVPNIFAYATINLTKPFGIDPAMLSEDILMGNYGSWDNAYNNMTAGGYEDVSIAGAQNGGYDWVIQSVTNVAKDFYLKFGVAPRNIAPDWMIGFYGTPNLGFGTLRFEAFYDPTHRYVWDVVAGANATVTTTNPTGTIYTALTNTPTIAAGIMQANGRIEIPIGTDGSALWAGAGLYYDLDPSRISAAAKSLGVTSYTQFKYAVTAKYLMGTFLNIAVSEWGTNVNIVDGASWTLYLTPLVTFNDGKGADGKVDAAKVTTLDLCLSGKLSFKSDVSDINPTLNSYGTNPRDDAKVLIQGIDVAGRLNVGTGDIYLGYVYTTVGAGAIWGANWVMNQGGAVAGVQGLANRFGGLYVRYVQPF